MDVFPEMLGQPGQMSGIWRCVVASGFDLHRRVREGIVGIDPEVCYAAPDSERSNCESARLLSFLSIQLKDSCLASGEGDLRLTVAGR